MICQQGRVLSLQSGSALIVVDPDHACQACARGQGCGMSVFSRWLGSRSVNLRVRTDCDWSPGDAVSLRVAPELLLKMAAWAYGLPLVGFIAGAALATLLMQDSLSSAGTDLLALLGGVFGLLLGALAARRWAAPVALNVALDRNVQIE
jgi:positive regulator of sigma E activity